jgi:hypothetical protein
MMKLCNSSREPLTENGASAYWKELDVRDRGEVETWVSCTVEHFDRPLDGEYMHAQRTSGRDFEIS